MRLGGLARVWGWLGQPNVLLFSAMLLMSAVMFAKATHNWAWVAFVRDTRMARAPLAYGDPLALGGARIFPATWGLVSRSDVADSACSRVSANVRERLTLIVLRDTDTVSVGSCSAAAAGWRTEPAEHSVKALGARLPPGSFALVDASGKVVYGSLRREDLRRVETVLTLLRTSQP